MKKLLFVLVIGAFAACGSGENKEAKVDSPATTVDTAAATVDTTAKAAVDTTAKVDTAAKK
ncbi:MAG: hypothetical protein RL596_1490 [Bacteroidota bacterium]|jgi:hypothetical protein